MNFSIIVCGRFHYHYFAKYLENKINAIYFSHKLTENMGVSKDKAINLFIKEYFVGGHLKILGRKYFSALIGYYHFVWKIQLGIKYKSDKINLIMLHGNCLSIINRIKAGGGIVIGDAVSIHPIASARILQKEAHFLGLSRPVDMQFEEKLNEIKNIDYLLCASETVKQSYIAEGFPSNKIIVLPYGVSEGISNNIVDRSMGIPKFSENKSISVVCVGQISLGKGQYHLLQSLILLIKEGFDVRVTLVGQANPDYFKLIERLNIEFHHIPHVPHDEVFHIMASHDVFALFSLEDGFGMVVTEAMSSGVPVVVSKYAGASEVIRTIGGGIVIDPLDYAVSAAAIRSCAFGNYPSVAGAPLTWEGYAHGLEVAMTDIIESLHE